MNKNYLYSDLHADYEVILNTRCVLERSDIIESNNSCGRFWN